MRNLLKGRKGQGMTEYILIIALIAVFVIGGVKLFGGKIKQGFQESAKAVGDDVSDAIKNKNK